MERQINDEMVVGCLGNRMPLPLSPRPSSRSVSEPEARVPPLPGGGARRVHGERDAAEAVMEDQVPELLL